VSVEECDAVSQSPRIHWSDLAAFSTGRVQARSRDPVTSTEVGGKASPATAAPLSISTGPPLPESELPRNLAAALERSAARFPDHRFTYVYDDGSERVESYEGLLRRARGILGGLRAAGLVPGDKLILQLKEHRQYVGAFWACQLGGIVPIPLAEATNYAEQNAAVMKLHQAWQLVGRPLVVTSRRLAAQVRGVAALFGTEPWQVAAIEDLEQTPGDQSTHDAEPSSLALLLLTSGSTGLPKAVMQSHKALLSRSAATQLTADFRPDGVTLNWLPMDHVGGIVMCHVSDVFVGCSEVLAEPETILQRPLAWLDLIDRFRATYTWAPNFAFALINGQPDIHRERRDLSCLRFLLNGGEAIAPKVARRFLELLEPCGLPPTAMRPAWGMSETCSGVTYSHEFTRGSTSDEDQFTVVGRPIHGFSVRIANDADEPVPEGRTGRLQVKGHCVTTGYYNDPERTRESFTADGWFITGDLGVMQQGALTITGREKGVIIVNGLNYYSHEIESVVEDVPGVEVSFTAACPVRRSDGTTEDIAIFFVPASAERRDVLDLVRSISDTVRRRIGLNPNYVVPLARGDIPKTEIGKIQRARLSEWFAEGRFDELMTRLDLELDNERVIPNWFFRRRWQRTLLEPNATGALDVPVLVVANDEAQVASLKAGLERRGREVRVVLAGGSAFEKSGPASCRIHPDSAEDYRCLFDDLSTDGIRSPTILYLCSAGPPGSLADCERELGRLLLLCQALAASPYAGERVRLLACTVGGCSVLRDDVAPWRGSFSGFLKTLPQEYPWLSCRHVDIGHERIDDALNELFSAATDLTVAWRAGERYVPRFERLGVGESGTRTPLALRRGGLYVLSGGAGGIGRLLAEWLIDQFDARVLMLGRRAEVAVLSSLAGIGQPGETLFYRRADICDAAALNAAVTEIEQLIAEPACGVFHLAGTFEETPIEELSPERLLENLRAKTIGTIRLGELANARPGAAFVIFSSVNGFFGGVSAAAYSAGNAFVDEYAAHLDGLGQAVHACAWTLWDETGMSVGYSLKQLSRSRGFFVLQPLAGMASLAYALARGEPRLWIGLDTASAVISQHCMEPCRALTAPVARHDAEASGMPAHAVVGDRYGTTVEVPLRQAVQGAAAANDPAAGSAPLSEAERMIAGIWERVLSRPPLGVDQNFFDCGGNSVSIARVNAELRKALGRVVPMTAMFQHSTIRSLASYITAGDESLRPQFAGDESAERGARRRSRLQRRRKVADKE
jgi:acyl-CoA synthetase (AMP-forming)/AMP-acid ligase II/NADP-dependent 3-hydroxy acid dehydrogenase YdfG